VIALQLSASLGQNFVVNNEAGDSRSERRAAAFAKPGRGLPKKTMDRQEDASYPAVAMMKKRLLGRTGLEVSPIAIGGAAFAYSHKTQGWDPLREPGRQVVRETLAACLDQGINYIDTAPAYGQGYSETLVGEVMKTRRKDCVLASKVWYELDHQGVIDSVHESLRRLQTDHIDILHFIYQAAARHFLIEAAKVDAGVVTMRTMTSGVLQREVGYLAPHIPAETLYELALKFVLSDSRVHAGIIGMRWPEEVARNVRLVEGWTPPSDFASMPRLTVDVYAAEDAAQ